MYKKCQELDYKIQHYRQMSRMVSDARRDTGPH